MKMITADTAAKIWNCYREIRSGNKLLKDMAKAAKEFQIDKHAPRLKDAFGRERQLQLGVPCGEGSHQLFEVRPELAESIIRAHIAAKKLELAEANEQARVELNADIEAESKEE
jgi:hypothetical protein